MSMNPRVNSPSHWGVLFSYYLADTTIHYIFNKINKPTKPKYCII